jgi:hypothetical protein
MALQEVDNDVAHAVGAALAAHCYWQLQHAQRGRSIGDATAHHGLYRCVSLENRVEYRFPYCNYFAHI